jgi:hypothetical protein
MSYLERRSGVIPMDRRERIIEISNVILGLRNQLRIVEAELDSLIGETHQSSLLRHDLKIPKMDDVPIADRIIRALERGFPEMDFDAKEMLYHLELPEDRLPTVRSTLHRLAAENRIARAAAGRFAALGENQTGTAQSDNQGEKHGAKDAAA